MKLFHSVLFSSIFFVTVQATALNSLNLKKDDRWEWMPTLSGIPIPINLANPLSQPQLLSFNAKDEVSFELNTLKNDYTRQILLPGNMRTFTESNFNKSLPTRIYTHGWMEYNGMNVRKYLHDAYLIKAALDVNLIYVNWEKASRTFNYMGLADRIEPIGIYIAELINFMVDKKLASLDDIHLIGWSLGAHAVGHAGKNVKNGKLQKIIGLDPAGPLFRNKESHLRLDKNDAKHVEVIHTSGSFMGIYEPVGTVNFYPNHGKSQPFPFFSWCRLDKSGGCSHQRSIEYFAESIYRPFKFLAKPCKSIEDLENSIWGGNFTEMGGEPGNYQYDASIYYLATNNESPFPKKWWW